VPVGVTGAGQTAAMLLLGLPVGEPDPRRRLARITATTADLKARLRDGGGDVFGVLHLPVPLARLAVRWMRGRAARHVNLFVTNVPGPPRPLWLAGARLLDAAGVAPLQADVPLGVAALSYAGTLAVTVNADAAVSDVDVLAAGIARGMAALRGPA
jgi:diacylglycerol O-acyltransferase / wax synthase